MSKANGELHGVRMPGESPRYRRARDELLLAERELRRQTETVAALRRKLPLGGAVAQDYVFEEARPGAKAAKPAKVRLSRLFGDHDSLVAYSFMFGPNAKSPCPMCTAMLDSLDGAANHVGQRASLVVIAKSPIARIVEFARERGWSNLRLLSSAGNTYNRDYFGETVDGNQMPVVNVFHRSKGKIRHFYHSELLYMRPEKGQQPRHVDTIWPLWNVLDLTPDGRGGDWMPRLRY